MVFRAERDAKAKKVIATGTNIKPVEVVMCIRAVKLHSFLEQMKSRDVCVSTFNDPQSVTRDIKAKDRFAIVDAVGVYEQDKTNSRILSAQYSQPPIPVTQPWRQARIINRNQSVTGHA